MGLVASWAADGSVLARYTVTEQGKALLDGVSGERVAVSGAAGETSSPVGTALQMDGMSTSVATHPIPRLTGRGLPWSISCWIKLDALPWNQAPIIDQGTAQGRLFFGVDAPGHLVAEYQVVGKPAVRMVSKTPLPPREWKLVSLSNDGALLTFTVNGKRVAGEVSTVAELGDRGDGLLVGHVRSAA